MYLLNYNEHVLKSDKLSFLLYYSALFRLCKNAFLIVSDTFWGPYNVKKIRGGGGGGGWAPPTSPRQEALPLDPAGAPPPDPT